MALSDFRRRRLVVLGLIAAAIGIAVWRMVKQPEPEPVRPDDPRLAYDGPYRNIHPDVRYVGDAACATCHPTECDHFHKHPMGRSIVPVKQWLAERPERREPNVPFEALSAWFDLERRDGRFIHKQTHRDAKGGIAARAEYETRFVIGSGHRGHSFFTARDGFLQQTPISWFSQAGLWNLSPGYGFLRMRPITSHCLFCHSGGVHAREDSPHRYDEPIFTSPAITCERCHGPAELHVREREANRKVEGVDRTIVNPRRLSPDLREDVCHQCHLGGEVRVPRRGRDIFDFRPGLPLSDFWAVYLLAQEMPGNEKAIGHVEQLAESKCFRKSEGRLGCTTCHDPHEALPADQRVPHHRGRCLSCHRDERPCSLDRAERLKRDRDDSCYGCHMPRTGETDIAHTATVNHRILRRKQSAAVPSGERVDLPLTPFHPEARNAEEADRDMGVALVHLVRSKPSPLFEFYLPRAIVMLEEAKSRRPRDVVLLEELGEAWMMSQSPEKARENFEAALALQPKNVDLMYRIGLTYYQSGRLDKARDLFRAACDLEPWNAEYALHLTMTLIQLKGYAQAATACRAWVEHEPGAGEGWLLLAHCRAKQGQAEEAARLRRIADTVRGPRYAKLIEFLKGMED